MLHSSVVFLKILGIVMGNPIALTLSLARLLLLVGYIDLKAQVTEDLTAIKTMTI